MRMIPTCSLGVPLLIGSVVLARAAFVPDVVQPHPAEFVEAQNRMHPVALRDGCRAPVAAVHADAGPVELEYPDTARCTASAAR